MKAIVCELCGSNELVKSGDMFVCQHCGTKYTTEEARKLLVEANVTIAEPVRVEGVASATNLLRRAKDFESRGDYDSAVEYYNRVLDIDMDDPEANRGLVRAQRLARSHPKANQGTPETRRAPVIGPNFVADFTRGNSGQLMAVFIDGKRAGSVWGGKTESYTLAPGTHQLGAAGGFTKCRKPLAVTVREGYRYRLTGAFKGLTIKFEIVEE